MLAAIGAASSIFEALKSLTSSVSSPSQVTTGFTQTTTTAFDITSTTTSAGASPASTSGGMPSSGKLSPDTLGALLAAQSQQPTATTSKSKADALNDLFSLIDGDGNGQISKSEFENALGAGGTNVAAADNVFGKMDKNGDGSVSLDEMASALKVGGGRHTHHDHAGGAKRGGNADALMQALNEASSSTTTNSDGSTTTSLTYADGSKVTLTSPAASATSTTAASSYNFVEQAIQRQAQALMASNAASISTSV